VVSTQIRVIKVNPFLFMAYDAAPEGSKKICFGGTKRVAIAGLQNYLVSDG
jgi:hypothetical protein